MASLTPFETGPAIDIEITSRKNAVAVQIATMAWNLFGNWAKNYILFYWKKKTLSNHLHAENWGMGSQEFSSVHFPFYL